MTLVIQLTNTFITSPQITKKHIVTIQHWMYSHVALSGVSSKQQCFIRGPLHWQTTLIVTTLHGTMQTQ